MTLLRNSSHYILNTFFYNCEALTIVLQILSLMPERLKFSFRLRISVLGVYVKRGTHPEPAGTTRNHPRNLDRKPK